MVNTQLRAAKSLLKCQRRRGVTHQEAALFRFTQDPSDWT